MRSTWLITGASGFLGFHLCRALQAGNQRVIAQVHSSPFALKGVSSVNCDFLNVGSGRALVAENQADFVVHCAALTNVDQCELEPDMAQRLNADVGLELSKECERIGAKFVAISTDQLWSKPEPWIEEVLATDPINQYGCSKALGEDFVLTNSDSLIIRTNFFGKSHSQKLSLSDSILRTLGAGEVFSAFSDVYFTPISVGLLVDLIRECVRAELNGIYNVAGQNRVSKYDFAVFLAQLSGLETGKITQIFMAEKKLRAPRPLEMSLNYDKIVHALGRPMPTLKESLENILA